MKLELREASVSDGLDILEMLKEIGPGQNGFVNNGYNCDESEFSYFLQKEVEVSRGIGLEDWMVPQTRFWFFVDGEPIGVGKVRHYLTNQLEEMGGNIGYCIRPSQQNKGYGKLFLGQLLNQCRKMGLEKVLLTCSISNLASRKVIESNGGRLKKVEKGHCFYWITIAKA